MTTTPEYSLPQRRSFRLRGYDYSQPGAYFVAICAAGRMCVFGSVVDAEMVLSRDGRAVAHAWTGLADHYRQVKLDAFVVRPNHIHGVIILTAAIDETGSTGLKPSPTRRHGLPEIVRAFKTFSARTVNIDRNTVGKPVWQRNYYEQVTSRQVV